MSTGGGARTGGLVDVADIIGQVGELVDEGAVCLEVHHIDLSSNNMKAWI